MKAHLEIYVNSLNNSLHAEIVVLYLYFLNKLFIKLYFEIRFYAQEVENRVVNEYLLIIVEYVKNISAEAHFRKINERFYENNEKIRKELLSK